MDQLVITDSGVTEVLASAPDVELVIINQEQDVVIEGTVGPQGPAGQGVASGGLTGDVLVKQSDNPYDTSWTPLSTLGGDKTFTQDFTPATTVTVTHNLGKYPAVTIINSAGDEVKADFDYLNTNQVQLSFASAFGGKVLCN